MRSLVGVLITICLLGMAQAQQDSLRGENYLSIAYEHAIFDKQLSDWQTVIVEGKQVLNGRWTVVPRLFVSERFDRQGLLAEADVYYTFQNKDYLMLTTGAGEATIFPKFKAGAEYFHPFNKKWEWSGGFRYYGLQGQDAIWLVTGSLSKYSGRHLTILRPFVALQREAGLSSYTLTLQHRYYRQEKEYVGVFGNFGYNPGLLLFAENTTSDLSQAEQYGGGIISTHRMGTDWRFSGQAEYLFLDLGINDRRQLLFTVKIYYVW